MISRASKNHYTALHRLHTGASWVCAESDARKVHGFINLIGLVWRKNAGSRAVKWNSSGRSQHKSEATLLET